MLIATTIILFYLLAAMLLAWGYFRHFTLTRPPIGVMNLSDVGIMMVGVVLIPYLYLIAPNWLMVGLLGLSVFGLVQLTFEAILRVSWAVWLVTLVLLVADGGSAWLLGTGSMAHQAINNGVMLIFVVGITNLWVQSGMRARDLALLGAMLALYDFLFTTQLPVMVELSQRLAELPFALQVVWNVGPGEIYSIGLGDLLFASVFPLVMYKAFGRRAGSIAFGLSFAACVGLAVILLLAAPRGVFPVMIVLGPLMVAQCLFWIYRCRCERTTWEYLQNRSG